MQPWSNVIGASRTSLASGYQAPRQPTWSNPDGRAFTRQRGALAYAGGGDVMSEQDPKDVLRDAAQRAKGVIADTAETVKNVATEASDRAQDFARQSGRQATAAAESLYGQGNEVRDVIERTVVEHPWPALLIAAAIGYGMACVIHNR
jgi:ElaB/YqjD/DUF883 family membrane-anchored ribosome-binding protein